MFEPWVGDGYENGIGGKRVLVVGESHYSDIHEVGKPVPDMTQSMMGTYLAGTRKGWTRTMHNVAWAVSGKGPDELDRQGQRGEFDVWSQLGFYNYIPVVLAEAARAKRPDRELFLSGKEPFELVIRTHRPQVLVVCGLELFPWVIRNHFPEYRENPWSFGGDWIDLPREEPIRAVRMIHPSAAFSHKKWHQVIGRAIASH